MKPYPGKIKLYHYVHCPFCVRVRLALGFLNIPFESHVIAYDDEETPVKLTGKKMLPILEIEGKNINESLDIIEQIDVHHYFKLNDSSVKSQILEFDQLLNQIGQSIHSLAMPYWIWTPEFNNESRRYFRDKKEAKRGPFEKLVLTSEDLMTSVLNDLNTHASKLQPFYLSKNLSIFDINLAAHLWGLYIVPEFQFPPLWHQYLQNIKRECQFNYHGDFWKL